MVPLLTRPTSAIDPVGAPEFGRRFFRWEAARHPCMARAFCAKVAV